ncbi:hypothetical protein EJ04DRAFT_266305 [Polyplosphaeria fusca]|uniref:Uncharacterized protein n=1 Tax=Polyplosphaeria fusca TaxID=682080 RepID=A0A9P4QYH0_9PLEO|nr:hypothetical protein EJ04DRAFT_266305 [Polyplosphaeria fusca]
MCAHGSEAGGMQSAAVHRGPEVKLLLCFRQARRISLSGAKLPVQKSLRVPRTVQRRHIAAIRFQGSEKDLAKTQKERPCTHLYDLSELGNTTLARVAIIFGQSTFDVHLDMSISPLWCADPQIVQAAIAMLVQPRRQGHGCHGAVTMGAKKEEGGGGRKGLRQGVPIVAVVAAKYCTQRRVVTRHQGACTNEAHWNVGCYDIDEALGRGSREMRRARAHVPGSRMATSDSQARLWRPHTRARMSAQGPGWLEVLCRN